MVDPRQTVVSCPGKVLIAGGYLLLDRAHAGIVVGTSSRFYTIINSPSHQEAACFKLQLSIRSSQFINAQWSYSICRPSQADLLIEPVRSSSQNKFVELAVRESLRLSLALQSTHQFILTSPTETHHKNLTQPYPITITILGDNDFYSQPRHDDTPVKAFNRLNTSLKDVHKTGLGSSAAMVTSLCSAILIHFTPSLDPHSRSTKLLLHNLSQYVHSLAQGKVGSGFDVSAALYGTHVYRRFSPSCLDNLLDPSSDQAELTPDQLRNAIDPKTNPSWQDPLTAPVIERFSIPKFTTLLLADVDAGSHTPSMVGQVLKWKKSESETADRLWKELSNQNNQLKIAFERLEKLSNSNQSDYLSEVIKLSIDPKFCLQNDPSPVMNTDDVRTLFIKVSSITKTIRRLMKTMGSQSQVPIEPDSQTELVDACEKRLGVIGSGVPGAGGYDAIWVLVFTPPALPEEALPAGNVEEGRLVSNLVEFMNGWSGSSVRVLSPASWVVGGTHQAPSDETDEGDGIKIFDDPKLVACLKSQLDLYSS